MGNWKNGSTDGKVWLAALAIGIAANSVLPASMAKAQDNQLAQRIVTLEAELEASQRRVLELERQLALERASVEEEIARVEARCEWALAQTAGNDLWAADDDEHRSWVASCHAGTPEAYRDFQQNYPASQRANLAWTSLNKVSADPGNAAVEALLSAFRQSHSAMIKRDLEAGAEIATILNNPRFRIYPQSLRAALRRALCASYTGQCGDTP